MGMGVVGTPVPTAKIVPAPGAFLLDKIQVNLVALSITVVPSAHKPPRTLVVLSKPVPVNVNVAVPVIAHSV